MGLRVDWGITDEKMQRAEIVRRIIQEDRRVQDNGEALYIGVRRKNAKRGKGKQWRNWFI